MKKLLVCAFFLCLPYSFCFGQGWSTLPADLVVELNNSSSGAALTGAILNAGTVSNTCTVGSSCSWGTPASGGGYSPTFLVGPNQSTLKNLGPIQLNNGGPLFAASSLLFNSIGHQDGDPGAGSNVQMTFPGGITKVAGLVGITLTMGASETNANDFDIFGFWQTPNGNYSMLQLNAQTASTACTGIPGGTIGIRLEGKPTIHTPCIPLTAPGSYFATQTWDLTSGLITLYVYTALGAQVKCTPGVGGGDGSCNSDGSVSVTMGDTGGTLNYLTIGNNEIGFNDGTITYFQNLTLNWSTAPTNFFWNGGSSGTTVQPPTNLNATIATVQ
jgi:hypothetical protein